MLGDPMLVLTAAAAAVLGIAATIRWPTAAVAVLAPVLMWPTTPTVVRFLLTLLLVAVGAIRALRDASRVRFLLFLVGGYLGLAALSYSQHGAPELVSATETRNSFAVMAVNVALVPAVALLRIPPAAALKILGLSGAAAAGWLLLTAETWGGRAALTSYNSDAIGMAAALSVLCLWAAPGHKVFWVSASLPPLALFVEAQTRSALVVLALGVGLLWLLRRSSLPRILAVLAAVCAAPFASDWALALQRSLFAQRDPRYLEVQSRVDALKLAAKVASDNSLLGVGWRHFTDESARHLGTALNAHNDLVLVAAESGLLAAALFWAVCWRAGTFRLREPEGAGLRAVTIAGVACLAFGNLLTDLRVTLPLWVLLGVVWGLRSPHGPGGALGRGDIDVGVPGGEVADLRPDQTRPGQDVDVHHLVVDEQRIPAPAVADHDSRLVPSSRVSRWQRARQRLARPSI